MLLSIGAQTIHPSDGDHGLYLASVTREAIPHESSRTPEETIQLNLFYFSYYISATKDLQPRPEVIVFPEWSLGGDTTSRETILPFGETLPDVIIDSDGSPKFHPCSVNATTTPTLNYISCHAQQYDIAVCYNAYDLVSVKGSGPKAQSMCPKLSDQHDCLMNTEICVDHKGYLIAKYYKTHLFKPWSFDRPATHEVVTFRTHRTNTPVGMIICFDILWDQPMDDIIRYSDARVILYSVALDIGFDIGPTVFKQWSSNRKAALVAANSSSNPSQGGFWSNGSENLTLKQLKIVEPKNSMKHGWLLYGRV